MLPIATQRCCPLELPAFFKRAVARWRTAQNFPKVRAELARRIGSGDEALQQPVRALRADASQRITYGPLQRTRVERLTDMRDRVSRAQARDVAMRQAGRGAYGLGAHSADGRSWAERVLTYHLPRPESSRAGGTRVRLPSQGREGPPRGLDLSRAEQLDYDVPLGPVIGLPRGYYRLPTNLQNYLAGTPYTAGSVLRNPTWWQQGG